MDTEREAESLLASTPSEDELDLDATCALDSAQLVLLSGSLSALYSQPVTPASTTRALSELAEFTKLVRARLSPRSPCLPSPSILSVRQIPK